MENKLNEIIKYQRKIKDKTKRKKIIIVLDDVNVT